MILGSLRDGGRDGTLVVVRHDHSAFVRAGKIAPTLQAALDRWVEVSPKLAELQASVDGGGASEPVVWADFAAPLPRAYEWVDGSAFLNHVILVRKARGAEPPETLRTDPLVYQGGSSDLLGPTDGIPLPDPAWGLDFEAEVCVILGDTPRGTKADSAGAHIRLVTLCNDVTLRDLVPNELAKSFGFFQSKPATAFAPLALTPDELGNAWHGGRLHRRVRVFHNGLLVGDCHAGPEMHFSFHDLIAHITRTRAFGAGTILGSGTVSNADRARGISCLAERRMIETIETGKPITPFLAVGDTVAIEVLDDDDKSVFGRLDQTVQSPTTVSA